MALFEWKLTPEYISENWTEELMALMFQSRELRYKSQREVNQTETAPTPVHNRLSDSEFFASHNFAIEKR